MKRGYDMTYQLSLIFPEDEAKVVVMQSSPLEQAERIIQKYLQVADHVSQYYTYCSERTPKGLDKPGLHPMMQRYYKCYHLVHEVGKRMIEALHLDCAYFDSTEDKYYEVRDRKGAESKKKATELLHTLNGFGYIQQVFNREKRVEERYLREGEEFDPDNCQGYEGGKPIGYWYWLFEDPIACIPVPVEIINKYVEKYG